MRHAQKCAKQSEIATASRRTHPELLQCENKQVGIQHSLLHLYMEHTQDEPRIRVVVVVVVRVVVSTCCCCA